MSPEVFAAFERMVARRFGSRDVGAVLEIGATAWTLLAIPSFARSRRVALNMQEVAGEGFLASCERVVGNSNELQFAAATFDCVLSSSVMEHDAYFWRSAAEIHRVLRPGGHSSSACPSS